MHRRILDTNIYIDWLNAGAHQELIFEPGTVKLLSAVVMMELFAGADVRKDKMRLEDLANTFRKLSRIVTPSEQVYAEAGRVIQTLRTRLHFDIQRQRSIVNDILIALSARSIGAEVVTQNQVDYLAIQKVIPFKLRIV